MSTSKLIKVGVGLMTVLFVLVIGSLLLFGLFNTSRGISPNLFRTVYFAFVLSLLGIVYISNMDVLTSKMEHAFIIISILIFSAGLAAMIGTIKTGNDTGEYTGGMNSLQLQNQYYLQQTNSMIALEKTINADNKALESEIILLTDKLNNRTPIVVETIVTIPAEIIYEEEPPAVQAPINYDDEEEYEEEDD